MLDKIFIPFDLTNEPASVYPLVFDKNVDVDKVCFLIERCYVVFDQGVSGSYDIRIGGQVDPAFDFIGYISAGQIDSSVGENFSAVREFVQFDDYYYASGYSAVHIVGGNALSGTVVLIGTYEYLNQEIMALVTFDNSSLIPVGFVP